MIADEHDEITYAKILAAAEEIRVMACQRPAQAAAMFEQARHLFELAQEIRNDWLRRRGARPEGGAGSSGRDWPVDPATGNGLVGVSQPAE